MRHVLLLAVLLGCSATARGEVFFDRDIQRLVQAPVGAEHGLQKIPVVITFKNISARKPDATLVGGRMIKVLKAELNRNVKSLGRRYSWASSESVEELWILNGVLTRLTASEITALKSDPRIAGVYWAAKPYKIKNPIRPAASNRPVNYTYGLKKLNVPEVRARFPHLLGTGVRVGVLDTGIAPDHPDLRGRLKVFRNFSPAREKGPRDDFGHGTHVSGTIVGGSSSGTAIGVAPDADLIVGRIFDGNGDSNRADILRSMQWMADPDENPATDDYAQVVNSSWSDDDPFDDRRPENEPFCQILQNWLRIGIIPVFSAGNTGPSVGTINLPAGCPEAFSVGATEQNDRSPHFSSTGPARWQGLDLMKPEVSAPGFHVLSAERYGRYEEMSGTSMAAPHVTGAFAILLQAYPNVGVEDIKRAMLNGAKELGDSGQDAVFGYGRIDILRSLELLESRP